jgi:hypothetical protein
MISIVFAIAMLACLSVLQETGETGKVARG